MCDKVEVSTWIPYSMSENLNSKTELDSDNRVQDGCDEFVLPRYCVSPVTMRTTGRAQIDEERQTFESGRFGRKQL